MLYSLLDIYITHFFFPIASLWHKQGFIFVFESIIVLQIKDISYG